MPAQHNLVRLEEDDMSPTASLSAGSLEQVVTATPKAGSTGLYAQPPAMVVAAGGPVTLPAEPVPAWMGWLIIGCLIAVTAGVAWMLHRSPGLYDDGGEGQLEDRDGGHAARAQVGLDAFSWDVGAEPSDDDARADRSRAARAGMGPRARAAKRRQQHRERRRPQRLDVEAQRGGSRAFGPIGPDDDEAFLCDLDRRIRLERARRERTQGEDHSS